MADERERRRQGGGGQVGHEGEAEIPALLDQVRDDPRMYLAYRREQARRRQQAAAGPASEPLTPEQEAQRQAEYQLLQQQKAQQHHKTMEAGERLWAAQHGMNFTPNAQEQKASFLRELKAA